MWNGVEHNSDDCRYCRDQLVRVVQQSEDAQRRLDAHQHYMMAIGSVIITAFGLFLALLYYLILPPINDKIESVKTDHERLLTQTHELSRRDDRLNDRISELRRTLDILVDGKPAKVK